MGISRCVDGRAAWGAPVAKADVGFERNLISSHIGRDFLGELRGGIGISAGYRVAAVIGRELPGLRDAVCQSLLIVVHQRGALLGRPSYKVRLAISFVKPL